MKKGFIRNIAVIIIILVVVFLSQQPNFGEYGKNLFSQRSAVSAIIDDYWVKSSSWAKENLLPKISGEVEKRGEIIKDKVNQEKQKISEIIGKKIKNYFSGAIDNIFNFGKNNNDAKNFAPDQELIQGQPYP